MRNLPFFLGLVCSVIAGCDCPVFSQKDGEEHPVNIDGPLGKTLSLLTAYPNQNICIEGNHLFFPDGDSLVIDDGEDKSFLEKLDNADIEDMFTFEYSFDSLPGYLSDPGRIRCEKLFKKMYGETERKVRRKLVTVNWFGEKIKFTSVNGANKALEGVASEIALHPELQKYVRNTSTFCWRKLREADRLSAHSYGIAIDIDVNVSDYWEWINADKGISETSQIQYVNRIPLSLVRIFEKHGFIWGGRWYHYDTMHFEYRPELIINKKNN